MLDLLEELAAAAKLEDASRECRLLDGATAFQGELRVRWRRRPMLMLPAAKSDAARKTPHSCVLISANAACSCDETSEKSTYLL